MKKHFRREIDSLDGIFEFVTEFFAAARIDASQSLDVELIIEELFTNMVKYRPEGSQPVSLQLEKVGPDIVIRLTDFGVEPFDITQLPEVDTTIHVNQKKVGGLGIHFVRQIADSLAYEHADGNTQITVVKKLEV